MGHIKRMLDQIIEKRANGNEIVKMTTKTKLLLKGLNPDAYTATSEDDVDVIAKVKSVAKELSVSI